MLEQLARAVAVGSLESLETLALEVADDDLADRRLVVDDENLGHPSEHSPKRRYETMNSAEGRAEG